MLLAGSLASIAAAPPSDVSPPDGQAIAEHGLGPAVPSCGSCHGRRFHGEPARAAPPLAGKNAVSMMDALYAMAANAEDHSAMAQIARHLDMAERAAVTAWLSRLPAKP